MAFKSISLIVILVFAMSSFHPCGSARQLQYPEEEKKVIGAANPQVQADPQNWPFSFPPFPFPFPLPPFPSLPLPPSTGGSGGFPGFPFPFPFPFIFGSPATPVAPPAPPAPPAQ